MQLRRAAVIVMASLLVGRGVVAQELVVANARIVDGTGAVIDRGSIVVRAGRIVSVTAGTVQAGAVAHLDLNGMTVIPGLIDAHVHLTLAATATDSASRLEQTAQAAEAYLALGVTTALDSAGHLPTLTRLRTLIETSESVGPRLLIVGGITGPGGHPVSTVCRLNPQVCADGSVVEADDPELARAAVRRFADQGVNMIKLIYEANPTPDAKIADDVLAAVADEAESRGLPLIVHAFRAPDALRAIELGADKLAHAPLAPIQQPLDVADLAARLRQASVPFATTAGGTGPVIDERGEFGDYRRGGPYRRDMGLHLQYMARMRQAFDAGVVVAFGTDDFREDAFHHELRTLSRAFSPAELIRLMTRNGAAFLGLEDELGTLEPGKRADMVVIDGNPLVNVSELENVQLVIKGGRIVVDRRSGSPSGR